MSPVRARDAMAAVVVLLSLGVLYACSSDPNPPSAAVGTRVPPVPTSPTPLDASADGNAADAADADAAPFVQPCLDDNPAPIIDAGSELLACPGGSCATHCANINANYKLGLAQVAVQCLLALPDCSDVNQVHVCVDNAIAAACTDTASTPFCTPLVSTCDPNAGGAGSHIDQIGCRTLAHGMSSAGRAAFGACIQAKITAGTCAEEVGECGNTIRE